MDESTGPLPLLVGVTGHLDPEPSDIPEIERKLEEELTRLAREWRHTPLLLLTGLARGCDTIAARVAHKAGIGLVAVLPMAREDYLADFNGQERAEFQALLSIAKKALVLTPPAAGGGPVDRVAGYRETGLFIAARSQILLAMYNGVDTNKPAGTSEVIRLKLEGTPPHLWNSGARDLLPGTGEIRVLRVRRQSYPEPPVPITWSTRQPETVEGRPDSGRQHFGKRLSAGALLDGFNRRVCRQRGIDPLWPGDTLVRRLALSREGAEGRIRELAEAQTCADKLAGFYRARINRCVWAFFGLVFLSTTLLDLAENIDPWFLFFQVSGLVGLLGIGVFWCYWRWNAWMDKEIDYRAIAEGLRVTLYWRLAGVGDSAADHYPADPRGELDWVRRAIAAREILVDPLAPPLKDFVREEWLEGQSQWMAGKIHGTSKNIGFRRSIRLLKWLFGGVLLLIILSQVIKLWTGPFGLNISAQLTEASSMGHLSVISALMAALRLPAVLAMGIAIYEIFGLEQLIRQYHRAGMVFQAGSRASKSAGEADFQRICLEVGRQALAENAEWAKIRRDRPLPEPNL